jgi:hypothetical protein
MPPFTVPPLSESTTVIVAAPFALAAEVQESVPLLLIAGSALKRVGLLFEVTENVRVWPASLGPGEIPLAHPGTLCAPMSSSAVCALPAVNSGASFTDVTPIVTSAGAEDNAPSLAV